MKKALVLMLLLGILTVLCTINASATLVGYWDFEDGTGTVLGNRINPLMNGTYVNEQTNTWINGKIGSYAINTSSDLQQYLDLLIAQGLIPNGTTSMSYSIWFNPRTLDGKSKVEG